MNVVQVHLRDFRNITDRSFSLDPHLTIIIGENAKGKTNILESIYVSMYGEGFRESKEEELMRWNTDTTMIESIWQEGEEKSVFTVVLRRRGEKIEKGFLVNKAKKTHAAYAQYQSSAVLFAPEHIDIITGPPEKRRDYFNRLLFKFDSDYKKKVYSYEHAVHKRNKILEFHKDQKTLKEELEFWNEYLETQATYITQKRQEYIDYLNEHREIHEKSFRIEYIKNTLTKKLLEDSFLQEVRMRRTLIGPQKDEFQIHLTEEGVEENVHHFGSRSEQRLAVFWLKLNEINYAEAVRKVKPLLLLDDVFSELDTKNKKLILDLIGNYQTILTTTEKELIDLTGHEKSIITL